MGAEPRALLGALLWLLAREGACDMELRFRLFSLSDSGEGKYPESLLSEESTVEFWKTVAATVCRQV